MDTKYGHEVSILSRPPGVFWFLFHAEKELAAGAAKSPCENTYSPSSCSSRRTYSP